VVLPEPFGPVNTVISPGVSSKETGARARKAPYFLLMFFTSSGEVNGAFLYMPVHWVDCDMERGQMRLFVLLKARKFAEPPPGSS